METAVTHFILLAVISGLTKGSGVLPDELTAAVGGEVMFTTTVTPPETPFLVVSWIFVFNNIDKLVITSTSSVNNIGPGYEGRIILYRSTASLKLMDLTLNDIGVYRVSIILDGGRTITGSTELKILEPVSNVKLTANNTDLIEFSSVSLSCSSSGSSPSFLWMNGSSEVTASERVQLTDGGRTLTIINVTRYDQGPYICRVSNAVSGPVNSDPVNLSINYGPENVQITGPSEINVKQTLTLTCSAASTPSASYTWILNGTNILYNSAVFTKDETELSDSGNYTCRALNNITGRTSSAVHRLSLTVTEKTTSTCPPGCIAGIVIACLVICGVAAAGGYFIYKKQKTKTSDGNTSSRTGGEGQENTAYSGEQELKYADVNYFHNSDGLTVQLGLQKNSQNQVNRGPAAASSPPNYVVHMQRTKRPAPQPDTTDATVYAQVQVRKK